MADAVPARGLCPRPGPARAASAAVLPGAGAAVERHQAAAVAMAGRELEALEARLLAMVASQQVQHSADLREADKLAGLASRNVEARVDSMERHQALLDQRLKEMAEAVQGLRREQEAQEERTAYFAAETRERLEQLWAPSEGVVAPARREGLMNEERELLLEERVRALEAGGSRAEEALGRRLAALEERLPAAQEKAATARAAEAFAAGDRLGAGEAAMLAVQELESLLRSEMKAVRKKCNVLQDQLDERTIISLKDFEQRLQEQDKMVKQVLGASQDSSSRLEEHEFRLGVARTKLDVHDQKISRLEAARWQRGNSGNCGDLDRSSCGTPTAVSPCTSPSAATFGVKSGEPPSATRDGHVSN